MTQRFVAPDSGPERTAYTCSFHAFRLSDGRMVVIDVVRSDDLDRRGLRAYVADDNGGIRALVHEAPSAAWAPFATDERPALDGTRNVLGRGEGWVAGRVDGGKPDLSSVAFDLSVEPLEPGLGVGKIGLVLVEMSVTDFCRVRTRGWVELDGERFAVDSDGSASVHFGRKLCEYAYLLTVPHADGAASPRLLYAAARGDDLRFGGALLGDRAVGYAYGSNGLPAGFVHMAPFSASPLVLGEGGRLELSDLRVVRHRLLDRDALTGSAAATYVGGTHVVPGLGAASRVALGRVIFDARGDAFVAAFEALRA